MVQDVSGKRCVVACAGSSEITSSSSSCSCANRYKLSKDGLSCVRNYLNGGEIAGIVVACVAVVAIIVIVICCLTCCKG